MKIKLTPELSYIIGLWKSRRTPEGIGIIGNEDLTNVFALSLVKADITTPEKIQMRKDRVFFYHSKYRTFFQNVLRERLDIFKYKNDYSAAYFAGLFDARGGYNPDGKTVYIAKCDEQDEMILLRLGFKVKLIKNKLIIVDTDEFLKFIKPFRKIKVEGEA